MRDRIIIDRETGEEIRIKDVLSVHYTKDKATMAVMTGYNGIYANIYVDREIYEIVEDKPKVMYDL